MNLKIEFARKMALAYTAVCRPLCQEMKLPQTAFDILMFLYNNPEYKTARDIVEIRNIKANLVSVNVEKLIESAAPGQEIGVFIGPEGGFEEAEVELAMQSGFMPVTLGKRILRTETAGLTVMAWLMYQLEDSGIS